MTGKLHAVETAISVAFENMPLGSQIVPFPKAEDTDLIKLARGFMDARGKLLLRVSVQALAQAKEAGVDVDTAMKLVRWDHSK